jgi:hypothetical protein
MSPFRRGGVVCARIGGPLGATELLANPLTTPGALRDEVVTTIALIAYCEFYTLSLKSARIVRKTQTTREASKSH